MLEPEKAWIFHSYKIPPGWKLRLEVTPGSKIPLVWKTRWIHEPKLSFQEQKTKLALESLCSNGWIEYLQSHPSVMIQFNRGKREVEIRDKFASLQKLVGLFEAQVTALKIDMIELEKAIYE